MEEYQLTFEKKLHTKQFFFDTYSPPRGRLQRSVSYFTIPFTSSPTTALTNPAPITETLSDYIWDLSFETFDTRYNHLAGRKFRDNTNSSNNNYVNNSCISNMLNNTPCTQTGYDANISIVDIYLETISPKENPTLQLDPVYGRRFVHDVSTTINLRNVGS